MKQKLTPEIAEMCGIVAGDGHLSRYISKKRTDYKLIISGHKTDDKEYFLLLKELFKKYAGIRLVDYNTYYSELRSYSKETVLFFEELGIPVGKKSSIVRMPNWIKADIKLSSAFLRGIADTDFSVVLRKNKTRLPYPRITCQLGSKDMITDICLVLSKLRINYCGPYKREIFRFGITSITYELDIYGHNNLQLWMTNIGFRNPKHLKKVEIIKNPPSQI